MGLEKSLKLFLFIGLDGLARILRLVEETGVWPDGLLDAYVAMIPKSWWRCYSFRSEALFVFCPLSTGFGLLLGWWQLQPWFRSWGTFFCL